MKTKQIVLLASCLLGVFRASAAEPWEDPSVNAINRLPARAISLPFADENAAISYANLTTERPVSCWIRSLDGTWDFKWKSTTATRTWEKTAQIAVPGCWQLQGDFDPPLYSNQTYPIAPDAPRVTKEPEDKTWTSYKYRNPVGLYSTTFTCPWRWWFRRTILHFNGVSAAFRVRVNGREVGYSEDSRLPAEFDITKFVRFFRANTLEVEVYKHCDGTYLEDQDFWRLSGIFRNVYLISEGRNVPFDILVETRLSDDLKSGQFIVRDEKGTVLKKRDVPNVQLWSCEMPFLYLTPIEMAWGFWSTCPWKWWPFGGIDYRTVSFGFRKIEIKDAVFRLNGKRVLFKGVNRHEMNPTNGYAVTLADMKKDIRLFKEHNINAVRTCHYPDDPRWYDLCDREGIMVVCEANVEAHGYDIYNGTNALSFCKAYEQAQVERGTRMIETYRNHPSIVIWSLGNETGYGPNFKPEYKAMRALDSTRPIQYENYCHHRIGHKDKALCALAGDEEDYTDIECPMYARPWHAEDYVKNKPAKPYILCEYAHAMGNSNGNLDAYWRLAEKYPSFQGGFVWDFADQALWKTDAQGKYLAYGGDFGDKPNDDNFNCNGVVDALRNAHPSLNELMYFYRDVRCVAFDFASGTVKIRNDFAFKSLSDYYCLWQTFDAAGTLTGKGSFDLGEVAPGVTSAYELKPFSGEIVVIKIYSGEGLASWETYAKPFVAKKVTVPTPPVPADFHPTFNFWRAPTDNDRGWKMPEECKIWKEATDSQKLPTGVTSQLKTTQLADGAILVDWTLTVPKGLPPIPRVGLSFTVPKTDRVTYFGRGPWENYFDRSDAAILGTYTATVGLVTGLADATTGTISYAKDRLNPDNYIKPGEQGYRTGCRRLTIGGTTIEAVNAPFAFNVWPYPQTMLENKKHQWELSEANALTVNVDAVQMGVGGDHSWGAKPHDAYLPGAGTYRLVFTVKK